MFRPSRNFKVPLVYGGQWKDHQTFQKWDPVSKRLVQVSCCGPTGPTGGGGEPTGPTGPVCPDPDPAVSVTLANLTSTGGDVTFIYPGPEPILVLEIYESTTTPVDTSGTPLHVFIGSLVSPNTYTFTTIAGRYYKAGLRVRHTCEDGSYTYSTYVYSGDVQYTACPQPDPVDSVTLSNITASSADVSWVYGGSETIFEVDIYEGESLPVSTSGTPFFHLGGSLSTPYTASCTPTLNNYYVASVRVKNDCGYSSYVYSDPVQYTELVGEVNVVGVGTGANTLLYSTDGGLTWTGLGNTIFTMAGNCAAWNGTMWVAGGVGTNALAYSYDGINWTGLGEISTGPSSTLGNVSSVTWDGTGWTAVSGSDAYATSFDGINWLGYSGITSADLLYNTATNGRITVGTPSIPPSTSLMGFTYVARNASVGAVIDANLTAEQIVNYTDILWDNSKFILTVGTRLSPTNSKFYSSDGRSWTGIPNVSYVDGTNIGKTTGSLYISRGTTPDSTEKSTDGLTWTSATDPALPVVQGSKGTIFGTDTRIFVCGYTTNSFAYTTDGTTWTSGSTGLSGGFKAGFYKTVPTLFNFEFDLKAGSVGVDPGTGNFTATITSFPTVILQFNKTDTNGIDAADFLNSLYYAPITSTIKITKDPSNYGVFTVNSTADAGTYVSFTCTSTSSVGAILPNDTVKVTYG